MKNIRSQTTRTADGFTLVELLTVIVIIGILAGIAIPAITGALRTAKEAAIRTEIDVMSQAMEAYKLEHGDYPPDFSDWDAVETHFRKAFPSIDNNELRILAQFTHYNSSMERCDSGGTADPRTSAAFDHYPHAIDRAEALVLCLGGFSKDKKLPFTGQGGPLVKISSAPAAEPDGTNDDFTFFQFNSERETGFFDFDPPQLSVSLLGPAGAPFAYSNDEGATIGGTSTNSLGIVYHPDPFPTYHPAGSTMPMVYFSSRSYAQAWGVAPTSTTGAIAWNSGNSNIHHFLNLYLPAGAIAETGVARPYVSNVVDTTKPSTMSGFTVAPASTVLQFAEDNKFQIVSAGLDDCYGGIVSAGVGGGVPGISVFPSGEYYNPFATFTPSGAFATISSVDKYQDDLCLQKQYSGSSVYRSSQPQLDNVTNFSSRTLGSDLP